MTTLKDDLVLLEQLSNDFLPVNTTNNGNNER